MTELGKIAKPDLSQYKDRKKIYFVRNIYLPKNASDKYKKLFYRYWKEVDEHIGKLEAAGQISKVFCESLYMTGDEAMKVLSAMNIKLEHLVKKKIEAGAELLPMEDREIFGAYVDWNNCLMVVRTDRVYKTVYGHFKKAVKERFAHIASVLRDNITHSEAGLLVMRDEDRKKLELPEDIEFFLVSPPSYDDLMNYIRDRDSEKEFWRT